MRGKLELAAHTPYFESLAAEAYLNDGDTPLEDLKLSIRNRNILRRNGLRTLTDILTCPPGTIPYFRNIDTEGVEQRMRKLGYKDFVV